MLSKNSNFQTSGEGVSFKKNSLGKNAVGRKQISIFTPSIFHKLRKYQGEPCVKQHAPSKTKVCQYKMPVKRKTEIEIKR